MIPEMSALVPIVSTGTGRPPSCGMQPGPRVGALKLPVAATSAAHLCSPARDLQRSNNALHIACVINCIHEDYTYICIYI